MLRGALLLALLLRRGLLAALLGRGGIRHRLLRFAAVAFAILVTLPCLHGASRPVRGRNYG